MRRCLTAVLLSIASACGPADAGNSTSTTDESSSQSLGGSPPATNAVPAAPIGYTDDEYRIYTELMESSMSVPESEVMQAIADRHGMTPAQVRATIQKVQTALFTSGGGGETSEAEVREVLPSRVRVKTVVTSSDFVSLVYVETSPASSEREAVAQTVERMPSVAAALFSIPTIQRARLIASYPAGDGGDLRVASWEVSRSEFAPGRQADAYAGFSLIGRAKTVR
ncbi:MAG: hypothetical protein AB1941_16800 [Gemmatimonadota bacterium]